jgi:phosphatidylglycerophosphatase A
MSRLHRELIVFLATGAYTGFFPFMPGTAGSVVGVLLFIIIASLSTSVYLLTILAFIALSVWVSERAEKIFEKADASQIVIDEVAGYFVTMVFLPYDWRYIVSGFVLFRIFDIAKPYPVNRINDNVHGGVGVVLDDIVAGVYANLLLQIILFFKIF